MCNMYYMYYIFFYTKYLSKSIVISNQPIENNEVKTPNLTLLFPFFLQGKNY